MNNKKPEKFYNKFETTYFDLFKIRFNTLVDITNAFSKKIGKDESYEIVEKLSEEKSVESVQQIIANNPVNNFKEYKELFLQQMNSDFMKNTTTFSITEETDKKFKLKVIECLWAKAHKDMNETELGYCVYCKPDYAMARTYHPKIKLTRTKTLMQGDDHCDHTFTWED
jgi:hypothetical protein